MVSGNVNAKMVINAKTALLKQLFTESTALCKLQKYIAISHFTYMIKNPLLLLLFTLYTRAAPSNPVSFFSILKTQACLAYLTATFPAMLNVSPSASSEPTQESPSKFSHLTDAYKLLTSKYHNWRDFSVKVTLFYKSHRCFCALLCTQTLFLIYQLTRYTRGKIAHNNFKKHGYFYQVKEDLTTKQTENLCINLTMIGFEKPYKTSDPEQAIDLKKTITIFGYQQEFVDTEADKQEEMVFYQQPLLTQELLTLYQTGQPIYLPVGGWYTRGLINKPLVIFFDRATSQWTEYPHQFQPLSEKQ